MVQHASICCYSMSHINVAAISSPSLKFFLRDASKSGTATLWSSGKGLKLWKPVIAPINIVYSSIRWVSGDLPVHAKTHLDFVFSSSLSSRYVAATFRTLLTYALSRALYEQTMLLHVSIFGSCIQKKAAWSVFRTRTEECRAVSALRKEVLRCY
jgi:hypothetical protein